MTPQTKRGQTGLLPCLTSKHNSIMKGSSMAVTLEYKDSAPAIKSEWKSIGELAKKLVEGAKK